VANITKGLTEQFIEYYNGDGVARIYVIDGRNGNGTWVDNSIYGGRYNTTYCYFIGNNTWVTKAQCPMTADGGGGGIIGNCIYVAGGLRCWLQGGGPDSGITNLCYKYNITSNSWTQLASMPLPQDDCGGVTADGCLWIIGGSGGSSIVDTNYDKELYCYNVSTASWSTKSQHDL
jgi:N-acetylneuraminic acid mutarotase